MVGKIIIKRLRKSLPKAVTNEKDSLKILEKELLI
jgi:hypothetical protein